jgi:CheY-like chemotaxis protein
MSPRNRSLPVAGSLIGELPPGHVPHSSNRFLGLFCVVSIAAAHAKVLKDPIDPADKPPRGRRRRVIPNRIILVEQDPRTLLLLREMLLRLYPRCDVRLFSKAENALPHMLAGGTDILIAGDRMGEWTGIDLVRALRRRGLNLPSIVLSSDYEAAEKAWAAGATEFVHKDGDLETLQAHVRALVEVLSPPNRPTGTGKVSAHSENRSHSDRIARAKT